MSHTWDNATAQPMLPAGICRRRSCGAISDRTCRRLCIPPEQYGNLQQPGWSVGNTVDHRVPKHAGRNPWRAGCRRRCRRHQDFPPRRSKTEVQADYTMAADLEWTVEKCLEVCTFVCEDSFPNSHATASPGFTRRGRVVSIVLFPANGDHWVFDVV